MIKKIYEDVCEECNQGYEISNDGLKCFNKIENCAIHKSTASQKE